MGNHGIAMDGFYFSLLVLDCHTFVEDEGLDWVLKRLLQLFFVVAACPLLVLLPDQVIEQQLLVVGEGTVGIGR